ncbi:DnaJ-like subfamily B member 13, partial [Mucuna pruriens]
MVDITSVFGKSSKHGLGRGYKSIIRRWFRRNKKSSSSSKDNPQCRNQTQREHVQRETKSFRLSGDGDDHPMSSRGCFLSRHWSLDSSCFPSIVSRNASRKTDHTSSKGYDFTPDTPSSLNKSASFRVPPHHASRKGNTSIMYSNSFGMLKPPPIEKTLECTLEDLCFGCKKNVMITRDVLTDTGEIVQEEELLTINVQPGWRKGTKITFEGKGNERPGAFREDIIFIVSEKRHQLLRREGDDLELCIEIPLVKALTGCTISVPLLGGEHMNLTIDNIISPGYEKIIPGQGMPTSREPEKRGNLKITFLVEFPTQLTENRRSEI